MKLTDDMVKAGWHEIAPLNVYPNRPRSVREFGYLNKKGKITIKPSAEYANVCRDFFLTLQPPNSLAKDEYSTRIDVLEAALNEAANDIESYGEWSFESQKEAANSAKHDADKYRKIARQEVTK